MRTGIEEWAQGRVRGQWRAGFTGIHALSPDILWQLTEEGAFPIVRSYLRLAAAGARILPLDVTGDRWMDVGTPERLDTARREMDAAIVFPGVSEPSGRRSAPEPRSALPARLQVYL